MQPLYHELGILAKAVAYKNLSAAALHVGISQSQLSRIIGRIEEEMGVVLLDRSSKQKSAWTPTAVRLAEIFERNNRRMENEIQSARDDQMAAELHIGTLEGLSTLAIRAARGCFENIGVRKITLDIFDLSELEAGFLSGKLDFILTSHIPGRQKSLHVVEIGYQDLERVESDERIGLFSTFEYQRAQRKDVASFEHVLVSNSLSIKKDWFTEFGGTGFVPGKPKLGQKKNSEKVYLIGSDILAPALWEKIVSVVTEAEH